MKKSLCWHIVFVVFLCSSCVSSTQTRFSVRKNGFSDRTYRLFLPGDYNSQRKYALLLAFHGSSGSGQTMRVLARFEEMSQDYIVVYPDSKVENWEEGCRCNKPYRLGIDDVGFVDALIDELSETYSVDTARIFAAGFSQGGLFVHNLGCKLSRRLKGIATVACPMSRPLSRECRPSHPLPVMMVQGANDSVLPFSGEDRGGFSLISSKKAIRFWADHNRLPQKPAIKKISESVERETYGVDHGITVQRVILWNHGHAWSSGEFDTSREIIEFFDRLKDESSIP